jgi:hypothetical protein
VAARREIGDSLDILRPFFPVVAFRARISESRNAICPLVKKPACGSIPQVRDTSRLIARRRISRLRRIPVPHTSSSCACLPPSVPPG